MINLLIAELLTNRARYQQLGQQAAKRKAAQTRAVVSEGTVLSSEPVP